MFKTEKLKALVNERLKAAAEEIFSLFETTLKDYEEIVLRSQQEVDQQRRRLTGWRGPLQLSVQEEDTPSEQDPCEKKTDLCEDDQEPPQIKEEQEEALWTAQTGEKQQEGADTKDSMFSIIYVQRNEEEGRQLPHLNQKVEDRGDSLPSSSCEQLKSEPVKGDCGASEPNSDCQMSEVSDDELRDRITPQQAGETADRPYTCSICNKNFRIKSILTRHMKTHTGEKPYSCSVCGKSFIQRSYLQTHMNSHSGQKPHTCSFCGRGFTQVGNMNAHIRIHTGEKPHSCTDCGKSFREKADLVKHTIIHTGEKPYICTVCNMKFSAQSNLTRHMKTHSGERPYSCTACGKRFIRRSHLIIHMKTHTGENP
ncbi:histone-lysine N-methyltransferase PRDM9-like [Epinephelus fuscoguttatus]|uniref:histone-lysine N-methyltransferase PRDM9-like n=1 Tax=Epinephelus fuscoguttatus TaxID=293821 RepID=UPI0020D09A7C|nr:histone-lysine N-methyltransferase PRDM9-like [Epinephelus fuscoguttatus]